VRRQRRATHGGVGLRCNRKKKFWLIVDGAVTKKRWVVIKLRKAGLVTATDDVLAMRLSLLLVRDNIFWIFNTVH